MDAGGAERPLGLRFGQQLIDQIGVVLRQPAHLSQQLSSSAAMLVLPHLSSLINNSITETIGH